MLIFLILDGRTSTTEDMFNLESLPDESASVTSGNLDKMEDEDFVNCICQIQEENGLMIQVPPSPHCPPQSIPL